jgi:hypothetical protein
MPPVLPSGLELFVDEVLPILRARGLFRTEYEPGETLRARYGLTGPPAARAHRSTAGSPQSPIEKR